MYSKTPFREKNKQCIDKECLENKSKHKKTNVFVVGGQRDRPVGVYIAMIAEDIQIELLPTR